MLDWSRLIDGPLGALLGLGMLCATFVVGLTVVARPGQNLFGVAGLTEGPKTTLAGLAMLCLTLLLAFGAVTVQEVLEIVKALAPFLAGLTSAGLLFYRGR